MMPYHSSIEMNVSNIEDGSVVLEPKSEQSDVLESSDMKLPTIFSQNNTSRLHFPLKTLKSNSGKSQESILMPLPLRSTSSHDSILLSLEQRQSFETTDLLHNRVFPSTKPIPIPLSEYEPEDRDVLVNSSFPDTGIYLLNNSPPKQSFSPILPKPKVWPTTPTFNPSNIEPKDDDTALLYSELDRNNQYRIKGSSDEPLSPINEYPLEISFSFNRKNSSKLHSDTSSTSYSLATPFCARSIHMIPMQLSLAPEEVLGYGSFGIVYKAMDRSNNHIIAVKEFTLGKRLLEEQWEKMQRELSLMRQLHHPNIVELLGEECTGEVLRLFMEYVPGGSIRHLLNIFGPFRESQVIGFIYQILNGLSYLHRSNVVHRDLKGDNLLVDTNGIVKLADLGAARVVTAELGRTVTGTAYYMAPEVARGSGHSFKADIWSVGCCTVEMLTGKPPFALLENPFAAMIFLGGDCPSDDSLSQHLFPKDISPLASAFLNRCFRWIPEDRPPAEELLQDPWILCFVPSSFEIRRINSLPDVHSNSISFKNSG